MNKGEIIVGLDIGTTKICAVVGELTPSGQIDIKGMGTHPSEGLRKGMVVNIDTTVSSIKKAVQEAELMAGCEINNVIIGIAGGHIKGFNSHGVYAIKGQEVTPQDKNRVMEMAKAVAIPADREVIHTLVQEYILDGQEGIQDPVGMSGVRLEVMVHIITGAVTAAHALIKCCNQAGLEVTDIVLQSLASAEAVLTTEERTLGSALMDFGGGTVDMAIFSQENIKHTICLPLGGNNLTVDLAVGLRTPRSAAEKIKEHYGACMVSMVDKNDSLLVEGIAGQGSMRIKRQIVASIIEPRVEEILMTLQEELNLNEYLDQLTNGMVLTGGSCLLQGLPEMCEQIFSMPTRRGYPMGVGGMIDIVHNPKYATAVGLVLYAARNRSGGNDKRFRVTDSNLYNRIWTRLHRFLSDVF
jgi:cell division protein FtsA